MGTPEIFEDDAGEAAALAILNDDLTIEDGHDVIASDGAVGIRREGGEVVVERGESGEGSGRIGRDDGSGEIECGALGGERSQRLRGAEELTGTGSLLRKSEHGPIALTRLRGGGEELGLVQAAETFGECGEVELHGSDFVGRGLGTGRGAETGQEQSTNGECFGHARRGDRRFDSLTLTVACRAGAPEGLTAELLTEVVQGVWL